MTATFSAAVHAFRAGNFREADELCRRSLREQPYHHAAVNLRGIIASAVGNDTAAVELMRAAVAIAPETEEYRRNLAKALMKLGQLDEAEQTLRDAVQRNPQSPQLLGLWGTIVGQRGELERGMASLQQAIEANPEVAANYFNLAGLHHRNRDRDAAIRGLEKVLELDPAHADALNNLAGLLLSQGRFVEALQAIQRLLQINPRSVQAHCNLSLLVGAAGDPVAAITALRNARKLDPRSSRVQFELAKHLIAGGDLDEADQLMQELRTAAGDEPTSYKVVHARILERKGEVEAAAKVLESIDEDPRDNVEVAMAQATVLQEMGEQERALELLQTAVQSDGINAVDGIGIHFALGKLCDALGRYDEAFEAFRVGNRNRKAAFFDFDRRAEMSPSERFITVHDPELFRRVPSSTLETEVPIFIVGMPRSGTSLVEQILASHPDVYGAGELTAFRNIVRDTYNLPQQDDSFEPLKIVNVDPSADQRCLVPKDWQTTTAEQLSEIGANYLEIVGKLSDAARVTDKMPFNYLMAPVIWKVFPRGRIIHCRRHPLDTCVSCFFQNFIGVHQYAYDLTDLGKFYREYLRIMAHIRNALEVPMWEVDYEQLVHDPESQIRSLLDYVGLDWHEDCLRFHQSKRVVRTASYQQVRRPLYAQSAGRWKNYEKHLGPLIEALGIDPAQLESDMYV